MRDVKDIFINKKVWEHFDEVETERYVQDVFAYYRENGFPYFPTDKEFRDKEFNKLMNYDASNLIVGNVVKQTMHGLSLAWSYMPHSWGVVCNGKKTPLDLFYDDELLLKVIRKRIRIGENMSDNGLRKMMKMFSGAQSVSNFRPTAACAIYEKYSSKGETVLDMSFGFGGRLLGAIKSGVDYIGYDPSTKTHEGVSNIYNDYGKGRINATLFNEGSENISLPKNSVSLAFTSPPYFNTEEYSNESTQSYKKYPTKEEWRDDYLYDTFWNTYQALEPSGRMIINIADVKSYQDLCFDTIATANRVGFVLETTMELALSNSTFKVGKSPFKYEPIFVFKKL
jgi:hypothetical protein